MSLRDDLKKQAAKDKRRATQEIADRLYKSWTAKMKMAPSNTSWFFLASPPAEAVFELVKARFKSEGYTVRPCHHGPGYPAVSITDDQA